MFNADRGWGLFRRDDCRGCGQQWAAHFNPVTGNFRLPRSRAGRDWQVDKGQQMPFAAPISPVPDARALHHMPEAAGGLRRQGPPRKEPEDQA